MKMKKLLAVLLVFVMTATCFAACGDQGNDSGNNNTNPTQAEATPTESVIPKDTVELQVYSQLANYSGVQAGWMATVLKEKFNVTINIIPDQDGVFTTRAESGSLGDIIVFGNDTDQYQQAHAAGLLWDWEDEDLLDNYGPYIKENMSKALEKNKGLTGTLHGFGHNVAVSNEDHEAFFYYSDIRWDLYKELGYPQIGTLEDLVDLLAKMVEICPTSDSGGKTYGISLFPDWDGNMVMYVKATAALYGYDEFGFGLYDCKTRTYNHLFADDSMYLRCLKFYNTLYQRGLLDPDSMTQTYDGANEAYMDGAAFYCIFNYLGSTAYNTETHTSLGKGMYPVAAEDFSTLCYGLNVNGGNRVWTIGANTQYPELCMSIINWLATPEGFMTYYYGPQGLTWDYDDEGYAYMTDFGLETRANKKTEMPSPYSGTYNDGSLQLNNNTWSISATNPDGNDEKYDWNTWKNTLLGSVTDILQDWRNFTGYVFYDNYLESKGYTVAPGTTYTTTTMPSDLKTTWEQVADCIVDYSWKAIYATTDAEYDKIVDEMKTKAYAYGYEECYQFYLNEAAIRKALEDATD